MAPPNIYDQGMTLHSIGFAALKFPALPDDCPVPISNQIGALQRTPLAIMNHQIAQISSQFLTALLDFQCSDDPLLNDKTSTQYYLSSALLLLNFLTASPDVCIRTAKRPEILHNVIEKMLDPDFESGFKTAIANRSHPAGFQGNRFDEDFGTTIQFLSTMLLYPDHLEDIHPRIKELIPKLKEWKIRYRRSPCKTISNASDRLVIQIEGMDPTMFDFMRKGQDMTLVCGKKGCGERELTICAKCKIQRYCGKEHQRQDWKYHKHICDKGLVEE